MKYSITYLPNHNNIDSNDNLIIYDFGHIKGFLFNNIFTMYNIIEKNNNEEICEIYYGNIPLHVFAIESYNCIFENNNYTINNFTIEIKEKDEKELSIKQVQPSQQPFDLQQELVALYQQSQQPLHYWKQKPIQKQPSQQQVIPSQGRAVPSQLPELQKNLRTRQNISQQAVVVSNDQHKKTQWEEKHQQLPLNYPNSEKQQWQSLEQLMRQPLLSVGEEQHQQHSQGFSHSEHVMKKQTYLQVRPPRPQKGMLSQNSKMQCQPEQKVNS